MRVTPFADPKARLSAGRFGVGLFLISLGVLFASSLVGYAIIRLQVGGEWPTDLPPLPRLLLLSTATLIISSATMHMAVRSVRRHQQPKFRGALVATMYLGLAFLLLQTWCWLEWLGPVSQRWGRSGAHRFALSSFYLFTGLHALHVVGGLIPLAVVTRRAMLGAYSAAHHPGVQFCAMYWHFLDVVWIVLYLALASGV